MQILGKKKEERVREVVSHDEVLQVGREKAEVMRQLVESMAGLLQESLKS